MKIDTSKIDGFDAMSAEDKLTALLAYEVPEAQPDTTEIDKLKALVSKGNTEAANLRRQMQEKDEALKARMSEAEKAEAERAEREKAMQDQLASYKAKERVANYTAKLMQSGYGAEAAAKMAAGLPEGVADDFFTEQTTFIAGLRKDLESQALNKQPGLSTGTPPKVPADADLASARKAAGLPA